MILDDFNEVSGQMIGVQKPKYPLVMSNIAIEKGHL